MEYTLNIESLKNIPIDKYEKDFIFIINGEEIKTNRLIADFLSPTIRDFHFSDNSLNTFSINITAEKNDESDKNTDNLPKASNTVTTYFKKFLNLFNFNKQVINSTERQYYLQFFYELGNINEYYRLQPEYLNDLTIDNVISRIQQISALIRRRKVNNDIRRFNQVRINQFFQNNENGLKKFAR